jgi:HEPN domain-containing protein
MNRQDFQRLAAVRLAEAEALLAAGRWDGAYYLAGYAVECGLKACILARVEREGVIFEDKRFAEKCWTHDIEILLGLAGLTEDKDADSSRNPAFGRNWQIAAKWRETARYQPAVSEAHARELHGALSDPQHGVLSWLSSRW